MVLEYSLGDLLCKEGGSASIGGTSGLEVCSVSESDYEFIQVLFSRERNSVWGNHEREVRSESSFRLGIVKWILHKRALFGYHDRTAYLALIYFDLFLSRTFISVGKMFHIRILSVACLSLAAKMEEREAKALREYTYEDFQFPGDLIQKMELMVLNTLEWRMIFVTPFNFLYFFISKFCGESSDHKEVLIRAKELIFALMEEKNVLVHRPSIVAAAAVLAAYDDRITKNVLENKMDDIPSWGSLEKEDTFSCYCSLQEILKLKTPKSDVSTISMSSDVFDAPIVESRGTRRRLDFDGQDQDCPAKKNPRS